jgi:hypothetical protein
VQNCLPSPGSSWQPLDTGSTHSGLGMMVLLKGIDVKATILLTDEIAAGLAS